MNKTKYSLIPLFTLAMTITVACGNKTQTVNVPAFNADSAYQYIQAQADFGPRVPNTDAHKACGDYLADQLEKFGAKVYNQYADLIAYDNTILKARNIIGAYIIRKANAAFCSAPTGTAVPLPIRMPTKRNTARRYSE